MYRIKAILFLLILLFLQTTQAQMQNGQWRDHLPYRDCRILVKASNKVFCATTVGLFSYNLSDNSFDRYSTVQGFSDIGISAMEYSDEYDALVIAYKNSNIDILKKGVIYNFSDIKRKQIQGGKKINHIQIHNDKAWLSTDFGITIFNIKNLEFEDTYYIGEQGKAIKVYQTIVLDNYIYASTQDGIFYADANSDFLIDYSHWNKIKFLPYPDVVYTKLAILKNKLLTYSNNSKIQNTIFEFSHSGNVTSHSFSGEIKTLKTENNKVLITRNKHAEIYDANFNLIKDITNYGFSNATPTDMISFDSELWIADHITGITRFRNDNYEQVILNSPWEYHVSDMKINQGTLWVAGGVKKNEMWKNYGFYKFAGDWWTYKNSYINPILNDFQNISSVAIDPSNPQRAFFGTWGYGFFEVINDEIVNTYNEKNSILESIRGYGTGYVRVAGVQFDSKRNLWLVTSNVENPIFKLDSKSGELSNIELNNKSFSYSSGIDNVFVSENDYKWLSLHKKGIFVFDDEGHEKQFLIYNSEGKIISSHANCIIEDLDNTIWVGTDNGIVNYNSQSNIFTDGGFFANQPKIEYNHELIPFLAKENINAIAIDGANRKWIGTGNSGLFLMNETCTEEILHFTSENSPLFSNNILSLVVDDKSGELYVGTDKGILSYQGDALKAKSVFSDVYVYPNPVRETYKGDIFIKGLVRDAIIKITDVSGNLVYETKSLGGRAVWNGLNFEGKRVNSGVYIVFCTNEDGTDTAITKFVFIN